MFTGLIAELGRVEWVEERTGATRIRVAAPTLAAKLAEGDSIAVSGVCLTALAITPERFEADLAKETIARTSLSRLQPGTVVNLELPTPAGTPLGGHVVQGHVDGVGHVRALKAVAEAAAGESDWLLEFTAPAEVARYVVAKGSITVEGISLTVAAVTHQPGGEASVTIAVIPHTYAVTNLHTLGPGSELNLEADVLAKYSEQRARLERHEASNLSEEMLIAAGF
ncbi:riboflavin synthase [Terriglobus sp.]|uniref:riboflavin synthase n=1 Tax=Terriglobus sp. TaxID=1889013 RepID=UPI003AFF6766